MPKDAVPFKSLIPLSEIIAKLIGCTSLSTQKVWVSCFYWEGNKRGREDKGRGRNHGAGAARRRGNRRRGNRRGD